ncbi:MAG: ACT domain-containing protein [Syntrophotaleaceae bacterium]
MSSSRFVITVIGLDRVGIVAGVTQVMAEHSVNIADIRQTIMSDLFTMIMLASQGRRFRPGRLSASDVDHRQEAGRRDYRTA